MIADGELRIGEEATAADVGSASVIGVAPDGRFLLQNRAAPPATSAIMALDWIRELRQVLGPPAANISR